MRPLEKPEPADPRDYMTCKVPVDLYNWLRERAAAEGRFIRAVMEDLIAQGLGGKRPWKGD